MFDFYENSVGAGDSARPWESSISPEIFAFRLCGLPGGQRRPPLRIGFGNPVRQKFSLIVILAERRVEDVGDFFAGGLVEKRGDDAHQHTDCEAGQKLVNAGGSREEQVPQNVCERTGPNAGDRAL